MCFVEGEEWKVDGAGEARGSREGKETKNARRTKESKQLHAFFLIFSWISGPTVLVLF